MTEGNWRMSALHGWLNAARVEDTLSHLVDVLGFDHWFDPDQDLRVGGVLKHGLQIRIRERPALVAAIKKLPDTDRPILRIVVEGIEALYAEHKNRGAEIVQAIGDRPWGDREYTVLTPDGELITFTQDIASLKDEG